VVGLDVVLQTRRDNQGLVHRFRCLARFHCPGVKHGTCHCYHQSVTGASYREVNSKVATAPKLKVEDKDRVNNSRRIKTVKLNIVKLDASLNKFS